MVWDLFLKQALIASLHFVPVLSKLNVRLKTPQFRYQAYCALYHTFLFDGTIQNLELSSLELHSTTNGKLLCQGQCKTQI